MLFTTKFAAMFSPEKPASCFVKFCREKKLGRTFVIVERVSRVSEIRSNFSFLCFLGKFL